MDFYYVNLFLISLILFQALWPILKKIDLWPFKTQLNLILSVYVLKKIKAYESSQTYSLLYFGYSSLHSEYLLHRQTTLKEVKSIQTVVTIYVSEQSSSQYKWRCRTINSLLLIFGIQKYYWTFIYPICMKLKQEFSIKWTHP